MGLFKLLFQPNTFEETDPFPVSIYIVNTINPFSPSVFKRNPLCTAAPLLFLERRRTCMFFFPFLQGLLLTRGCSMNPLERPPPLPPDYISSACFLPAPLLRRCWATSRSSGTPGRYIRPGLFTWMTQDDALPPSEIWPGPHSSCPHPGLAPRAARLVSSRKCAFSR